MNICGQAVLSVRDLSFAYGQMQVLQAINLEIRAGEWVSVSGANGAGKSTLLRCIAGLLQLTSSAKVVHSGIELRADPAGARQQFGFAVAPDEVPGELTLAQYLDLVRSAHRTVGLGTSATELQEAFKLGEHAHKRLACCSLGTRQKAAVVAAFVGEPNLVILDEPFNGLDAESLMAAKRVFSEFSRQRAILMASHTIEIIAEWCSRIDCLVDTSLQESIDLVAWRRQKTSVRELEHRLVMQREATSKAPASRFHPLSST